MADQSQMHEGTHASSYDKDELAIVDRLMLIRFGWKLVDGLGKVSFNLDQQRQYFCGAM